MAPPVPPQPQGAAPSGGGGGSKKKRGKGRRGNFDDDYGFGRREANLAKPADQERLTEVQMKEEFVRNLTCMDPTKLKNRMVWDFNEKQFVLLQEDEETIHMFHLESELIFKESKEDIKEYPYTLSAEIEDPEFVRPKGGPPPPTAPPSSTRLGRNARPTSAGKSLAAKPAASAAPLEDADDPDDKEENAAAKDGKGAKLLNQFNFCDRAAQTTNNPVREHSAQTVPPPRSSYKDYCNAWIIFDLYEQDEANRPKDKKKPGVGAGGGMGDEEDEEHKEEGEEKKEKVKEVSKKDKDKEGKVAVKEKVRIRKASILEGAAAQESALAKSAEGLKILERLVMQNVFTDVLHDFKYYEDASDEFRESGEGTILPLWKFTYDKAKKHHVTSISWAQSEPDMFAVSYGSFNFMHPILDGMVLVWSLRNTAFPEHIWMAPKGAMSCAIHPQQDCLVAVGLYDGNVALLQLREDEDNVNKSVVLKNCHIVMKHRSPIWSVCWADNDMDNSPNFYSCGMDGQVIHWIIDPSASGPAGGGGGGLSGTPIATLHLPVPPVQGPDGTTYKLFGCARAMAIHPKERNTFLVGTAEGNIFQCSMLYGSRFQQIYNAHFLPVAALEWNYFHPDVFISCSEDWTIKVWDRNDIEPMYVFEIGVAILDCAWAPYSSTVFAAVSEEGKALVYDLDVNKEKPICCQQVVTKKKVHPNRIAFNPYYPLIIIGDDRGQLTSLKLSPNCRNLPRDPKGRIIDGEPRANYEITKMSKLLSLVRDPESVTGPKILTSADEKQAMDVLAVMGAGKK